MWVLREKERDSERLNKKEIGVCANERERKERQVCVQRKDKERKREVHM